MYDITRMNGCWINFVVYLFVCKHDANIRKYILLIKWLKTKPFKVCFLNCISFVCDFHMCNIIKNLVY